MAVVMDRLFLVLSLAPLLVDWVHYRMGWIMAWKKGWLAGWQQLLGPLRLGLL